jgi:hypothetical protein
MMEPVIFLVENAKVKLKKLLTYSVEILFMIENQNNNDGNINLNYTKIYDESKIQR